MSQYIRLNNRRLLLVLKGDFHAKRGKRSSEFCRLEDAEND